MKEILATLVPLSTKPVLLKTLSLHKVKITVIEVLELIVVEETERNCPSIHVELDFRSLIYDGRTFLVSPLAYSRHPISSATSYTLEATFLRDWGGPYRRDSLFSALNAFRLAEKAQSSENHLWSVVDILGWIGLSELGRQDCRVDKCYRGCCD